MIRQSIKVSEDDWLMANKNPQKSNVSNSMESINPPFTKLWDYNVDAGFYQNSLTLSDAVLFASTLRGEIYAIDISSGKRLGHLSKFGGSFYCAPVINGKNLIFTIDGNKNYSLVNYDITAGKSTWEFNGGFIRSSPIMIDGKIFFANKNGKLFCVSANDGMKVWESQPGEQSTFFTSPSSDLNNLYIGNTTGSLFAISLQDGSVVWQNDFNGGFYCDASVQGTTLFIGNDDNYFRAISNNGDVIWEKNLGTKFLSSSTFYNNLVITAGINGKVFALDISNGEVVWEFQTHGSISASPVLSGNLIFIGSFDKKFYCIDAENGIKLWDFETDSRIKTTALVWRGYIFAGSEDRKVYCFK